MRTVSYAEILQTVVSHDGQTLARLQGEDQTKFRDFANLLLPVAWEMESWPELMRVEERWFRAFWASATAYTAPSTTSATEVYYGPARKYYQALRASTGQAPATVSGTTITENSAYWAECKSSYSGSDWADATAYVAGDIVRNPTTERYYQCHTAHTSSGSFDATKFGILTQFDRYVAYAHSGQTAISEVVRATDKNPRIFTSTEEYTFGLSQNGVQIQEPLTSVWLEYSIRCPRLHGSPYSASAAYTANVDQIYYSSASTLGNFYDCITTTTAGQTPDTHAAKWQVVEIPYIFKSYLALGIYGMYLQGPDGQLDKARLVAEQANNALRIEANKLWRRQGQVPRIRIATR